MRNQMNSNSQKTALALIFAASLSLTAIPAFAEAYDFEQAGKVQNQGQTLGNGGAIHTQPTHTTTTTTTNTQAVEGKAQHDNVSDAGEAGQSIGEDAASATKAVGNAATKVGHGVRDTTKAIGHSTRDFFRGIGDGVRKAW
tara:strand:+ start:243 stop:665 length:423 start_codon:yes stop_codon:yes gene_type:complete